MSTDTRADFGSTAVVVMTGSGPIARVIAASLAAGLVVAAVLTLGVFAGGTESVITGSLLLSFGLGWALLAALSGHYTNRPQRWAAVPAGFMAASGAALLALDPGNDVMASLGWVWPPVVLVLAAWMWVRMRRAVAGRGRWLLTPVIAALAIAAVGATYENVALHADDRILDAAPGKLYDVGGHQLHLDCRGEGSPTVVLFNGLGEVSASWARITGQVGTTTRICAYDRAGQGWSEDIATPQDGIAAAADLHALLDVAGESGPFVLAGHSSGGTYAMTYAARYPQQVAGMVLLDSSSPEQPTLVPSFDLEYAVTRRFVALAPTVARLGLAGVTASTSHLPQEAADQVEALTATPRGARTLRDEQSVILDVFSQAQALTTLDGRPLAVLTATENLATQGWADGQDQLTELSANHVHRTVTSTHIGLLEDEGPAAESVRAIAEVLAAVRTGTPMDAS